MIEASNAARVIVAAGAGADVSAWLAELKAAGMAPTVVTDPALLTEAAAGASVLFHGESFTPDAVDALRNLRREGFSGETVVVTPSPSVTEAAGLMGLGCADYLPASLTPAQIVRRVGEALGVLERSHARYEVLWRSFRKRTGCEHVQGVSTSCRGVYRRAAQAAPTDATVLIEGETGTGKEYLARAIHFLSPRRDKPFVAVNCGAIPEALLESELFGHERGAFTSASRAKPGLCETAHRGSIFLDEIGDMSPAMQVKLLRFVQEKSFGRIGGLETIKVDVRIIAATNQDLRRAVAEGRFREDLYYRLAVIGLQLPPLRDRLDDLRCFADLFVRKHQAASGDLRLCECAHERLAQHPWPGNLRELENAMQRAVVTSFGPLLHADDMDIPSGADFAPQLHPLSLAAV